jgi:hypothetical protein
LMRFILLLLLFQISQPVWLRPEDRRHPNRWRNAERCLVAAYAVRGSQLRGITPGDPCHRVDVRTGLIPLPHTCGNGIRALQGVSFKRVADCRLWPISPSLTMERREEAAAADQAFDVFVKRRSSFGIVGRPFQGRWWGRTPGVWYRIRTCYACVKSTVLYPMS